MKKIIILSLFLFGYTSVINAQPVDKPKKEISLKEENEKSVNRAVPFHRFITSQQWRGARVWFSPTTATVDSVLLVVFNANGTVTWNKQGWEHVPRAAGTYKVMGNKLTIDFDYFPYTHHLEGVYDAVTGKITGTFSEVKDNDPNAPSAYVPGKIKGDFNFYKK